MTLFLTWILIVVAFTAPLVVWLICRERRAWQKVEAWRCPRCTQLFGRQTQHRGWAVKADPLPRGVPTNGPLLHCSGCGGHFPFSWRGEFVTQWAIGDARFSK